MHMGPAMWVVSETSFYNTGTPYEKWLVSVLLPADDLGKAEDGSNVWPNAM